MYYSIKLFTYNYVLHYIILFYLDDGLINSIPLIVVNTNFREHLMFSGKCFLTMGPQRGPLVTQQISVLHIVHRIQSHPSFFITMISHVGHFIASPFWSIVCLRKDMVRSHTQKQAAHVVLHARRTDYNTNKYNYILFVYLI